MASGGGKKIQVPLLEYIGNVMKFIEAILSNNATDDHARLFVAQGGVEPLARLVVLPNLNPEFGQPTAFNSVASAVRYIVVSVAHHHLNTHICLLFLSQSLLAGFENTKIFCRLAGKILVEYGMEHRILGSRGPKICDS